MADDRMDAIRRMRREKDAWMRADPHSPIPSGDRHRFAGLRYFEPDPRYVVEARWEPSAAPRRVRMQTSTGDVRDYLDAGRLVFALDGQELRLAGFVGEGRDDELFVPFRDATSGKETYGAGRYLEVPMPRDGRATIDFNLAYNPSCAYSEEYSCPMPPPENWLKAPVRAGERTYGS